MFLGLAYGDFDAGRRFRRVLFLVAFDDGLDGVAEQLADYVFDVVEDVGKAGVKVAYEADFWDWHVGAVGRPGEGRDGFGTALNDISSGAADEDFADEVGLGDFGAG